MESIKRIMFFCVLFVSCVNADDISGIYVNNIDLSNNIDTIKIYKNGIYERLIYDKNNKTLIYQHSSFWRYYKSKIVFNEFLENYGGYTEKNKKNNYDNYLMTYFLPIEKTYDGTRIVFDEKRNHFFLKKR